MIRNWEEYGVGPLKDIFFIAAAHIPGILNLEADQKSRKSELRTEWTLHEYIFDHIQRYLDFYPSVDLLASRINPRLPRFFAYRPDPKAEVINAFCVSWHNLSFYCFPPFSCIGKVLQKNNFWQSYWYINCPKLGEPVLVYHLTRPTINRGNYHST